MCTQRTVYRQLDGGHNGKTSDFYKTSCNYLVKRLFNFLLKISKNLSKFVRFGLLFSSNNILCYSNTAAPVENGLSSISHI